MMGSVSFLRYLKSKFLILLSLPLFFLFGIDLQNPVTWTNLALHILLILLIYLITSWMFGEQPVCLLLQIYSATLASGFYFSLFFINALHKVSRGVCLKKLKLNVSLCNFP